MLLADNPQDRLTTPLDDKQKQKIGHLYFTLMREEKRELINDRQRLIELQYGPCFIDIAKEYINHLSTSNFGSAAEQYYLALSTPVFPQVKPALEGLINCYNRDNNTTKQFISKSLTFIQSYLSTKKSSTIHSQRAASSTDETIAHFKNFLKHFSEYEEFTICIVILAKLNIPSDYEYLSYLIKLCTGQAYKTPSATNDDKVKLLHTTLIPEFESVVNQPQYQVHHVKIYICLALMHFDLTNSTHLIKACNNENNINLALQFLKSLTLKQTPCFELVVQHANRMHTYITNHQDKLIQQATKKQSQLNPKAEKAEKLESEKTPLPPVQPDLSHPLQQTNENPVVTNQPLKSEDNNLYPTLDMPTILQSSDAFVIASLKEQLEKLQNQTTTQQKKLDQQQIACQQYQTENQQLQIQLQEKENELAVLRLTFNEQAQEMQAKEKQIEELKTERDTQEKRIKELETEIVSKKRIFLTTVSIVNSFSRQLESQSSLSPPNLPSPINN